MILLHDILYLSWEDMQALGYKLEELRLYTRRHAEGSPCYAHIADPEDDSQQLIAYHTIPADHKTQYRIPDRDQIIAAHYSSLLESRLMLDSKAFDLYYHSPAAEYARDLQTVAAWLMLLAPLNRSEVRQLGLGSKEELYHIVILILCEKAKKHDLATWNISNMRRFKGKLKPFLDYYKQEPDHFNINSSNYYPQATTFHPQYEEALRTLISGKYGKRNAAKIQARDENDDQAKEMQALVIRLHSEPLKRTIEQTYLDFQRNASELYKIFRDTDGQRGWDPARAFTRQTMQNFLYRPDIKQVWYGKRHGKKPAHDTYTRITKRLPASYANAKWVIDGTPVHMYFMHKGSTWQRLNVFFVMDEHSWAILGYNISFTENEHQVISALRDACRRTGTMPYQIQSDNSSAIQAHHTRHAITTIAKYYTPAKAGNARSKPIEAFNAHFNDRILKFKPGYMGNPHASLERQPNMDEIQRQVKGKLIPTFDEAYKLLDQSLNEWNRHIFNGARPLEKYNNSLQDSTNSQRRFTSAYDVEAFWYQPGRKVQVPDTSGSKRKMMTAFEPSVYTFSNRGIIISRQDPLTKKNEKYYFDVPDASFNADHIGDRFTLRIEPENFDRAIIYKDGRPLQYNGQTVIAQRSYEQASAIVDSTPDERMRLAAQLHVKQEQHEIAAEKFDRYMEVAKKNGHDNPIAASWINGKDIAGPAAAELNEALVGRLGEVVSDEDTQQGQDRARVLPSSSTEAKETPTIKRF